MKKGFLLYLIFLLLFLTPIISWGCDGFQAAPGTEGGEKGSEQREDGGLCICIDEFEQPGLFFERIEKKLKKWRKQNKK